MTNFVKRLSDIGIDHPQLLIVGGMVLSLLILLTLAGRFLFRKNSVIMGTISAAFTVFFVYLAAILLPLPPPPVSLPLMEIDNTTVTVFRFTGDYLLLANHLLRFLLLAFYAALVNQFLPKGKLLWPLFRILSIAIVFGAYLITISLLSSVLTPVIAKYSSAIILGILALLLATGSIRLLIGAAVSTVNPVIAVLFTFFFVTLLGKQILKAALVTVIFALLLLLLQSCGLTSVPIDSVSPAISIPIAAGAGFLWFLIGKLQ